MKLHSIHTENVLLNTLFPSFSWHLLPTSEKWKWQSVPKSWTRLLWSLGAVSEIPTLPRGRPHSLGSDSWAGPRSSPGRKVVVGRCHHRALSRSKGGPQPLPCAAATGRTRARPRLRVTLGLREAAGAQPVSFRSNGSQSHRRRPAPPTPAPGCWMQRVGHSVSRTLAPQDLLSQSPARSVPSRHPRVTPTPCVPAYSECHRARVTAAHLPEGRWCAPCPEHRAPRQPTYLE